MLFSRLMSVARFATIPEAIQTIPGHKPPVLTDSPSGRYAGALFSSASKTNALQTVLIDILHLQSVLKASPGYRDVLKNSAINRRIQKEIVASFAPQNYHFLTQNFLNTLIDVHRLSELEKIIETYIKYCKILNKQEDITVISAVDLKTTEKDRVVAALKKSRPGVTFKVTYKVDDLILGGLQVYSGHDFLDCSLRSRITRLKSELNKIA